MENPYAYKYSIIAYWGPRAESLEAMASRYLRMLADLSTVDPAFGNWLFIGEESATPLGSLSLDDVVAPIEDGVCRADDGRPTPQTGYLFSVANGRGRDPRRISISIHAGSTSLANYFINVVSIETDVFSDANAKFINVAVFKAAMLAVIDAWDATWCAAAPGGLHAFRKKREHPRRPYFDLAWISYLSPRFAPMVAPPRSAIVDRTPNGGLVMIATEDRFDFTNPAHVAAAREIEASLAPVNALPWPPDR